MEAEQQSAKNNSTLIVVGVILVVGIAAGFGYMFMKKGAQTDSKNSSAVQQQTTPVPPAGQQPVAPPPSGDVANQTPPPPPSVGFYGKVMKRNGQTVTVQQLLPPTTPGGKLTEGKTYTVTADEKISYVNQKKTQAAKPGEPPFTPEPGSLAGLVKGLFVYIETSDDIAGKTAVTANQVMYSVESPF